MENTPSEDVFPIQDGDFPASYVCLPEGTSPGMIPPSSWHPRLASTNHQRQRRKIRCCRKKSHPLLTSNCSRYSIYIYILGGGFKYFLFSSLFGEDSHFDSYISKRLVQPPTSIFIDDIQNLSCVIIICM